MGFTKAVILGFCEGGCLMKDDWYAIVHSAEEYPNRGGRSGTLAGQLDGRSPEHETSPALLFAPVTIGKT
jgi:hypothetical protein